MLWSGMPLAAFRFPIYGLYLPALFSSRYQDSGSSRALIASALGPREVVTQKAYYAAMIGSRLPLISRRAVVFLLLRMHLDCSLYVGFATGFPLLLPGCMSYSGRWDGALHKIRDLAR